MSILTPDTVDDNYFINRIKKQGRIFTFIVYCNDRTYTEKYGYFFWEY